MQYSEKFKERMVERLLGLAAVSATALSREVGTSRPCCPHMRTRRRPTSSARVCYDHS